MRNLQTLSQRDSHTGLSVAHVMSSRQQCLKPGPLSRDPRGPASRCRRAHCPPVCSGGLHGPAHCPWFTRGPREPQPQLRALPSGEGMDLCPKHACRLGSVLRGRTGSPGCPPPAPALGISILPQLGGAAPGVPRGLVSCSCIRFLHFPAGAAAQHFNFSVTFQNYTFSGFLLALPS